MATYVLVHGGGHGGWCWRQLSPLLRAAGHEVYTPTLTGLGERAHLLSPDIDLDTHVADITAVLEYEDCTEVILVGHSYGGMVITGVADRATRRISHLVYLDGAIPVDGESLADVIPALIGIARSDARVVDGVELALWPDSPASLAIYGVTDPDDAAWLQGKLTPHPWKSFVQPLRLTNEAAVKRIPRSNINSSIAASGMVEGPLRDRAQAADQVWEIDTGHDLMITAPREVAEILLQLPTS